MCSFIHPHPRIIRFLVFQYQRTYWALASYKVKLQTFMGAFLLQVRVIKHMLRGNDCWGPLSVPLPQRAVTVKHKLPARGGVGT